VHADVYYSMHCTLINSTPFISNRNDGDEPDYMAVNPTQWLSSTMQACCKKYFSGYMYDACMGRYPPDHDDCNVMLYYPDWNGSNQGCVGDGK
jgi:hypothetical protein